MVRIILRHQGTIDEFTGDGILAFFGAPRRIADSQWQAILCAMEMRREMPALNEDLMRTIPDLGQLPLSIRPPDRTPRTTSRVLPLKMGIAINCGNVIVGNIGCEERKKYGAVGTPINMAFRMEKKAGPGEIIISADVHSRIAGRFETVSVPEVVLAGFPEPVTLFKVMGESLSTRGHIRISLHSLSQQGDVAYQGQGDSHRENHL
jgi:class 3 adenylate cyclase